MKMLSLKTNMKVATTLVKRFDTLGSRGYDQMGIFAQLFLSNLTQNNSFVSLNRNYLASYISTFEDLNNGMYWFSDTSKQKSKDFLELVKLFDKYQTNENAQAIINYK